MGMSFLDNGLHVDSVVIRTSEEAAHQERPLHCSTYTPWGYKILGLMFARHRISGMSINGTRQRNAVSEGMALGLLAVGRDAVPFDTFRVGLAFDAAWRAWPYRSQFSQVDTDLAKGLDPIWAITRVGKGSSTARILYWEDAPALSIRKRRADWDIKNPNDIQRAVDSIDGDVPLEGWVLLASEFVAHLQP